MDSLQRYWATVVEVWNTGIFGIDLGRAERGHLLPRLSGRIATGENRIGLGQFERDQESMPFVILIEQSEDFAAGAAQLA